MVIYGCLWISQKSDVWCFTLSAGEKKNNLPSSLFSSFTFFIFLPLQPIKWAPISKSTGVEKLQFALFSFPWNFFEIHEMMTEKLETAKKKQPEKWGQVNPSHLSPWHHPNIFHFILFSNNNNRKQTFLSSYQVSFVNTQKGNCFFSLLP